MCKCFSKTRPYERVVKCDTNPRLELPQLNIINNVNYN